MIRSALAHRFILSPNLEPRRGEQAVDMIVLHYTGMQSAETACSWLCNPASGVSCHYLVDGSGHITQMVDEEMRAWHAGVSSWGGITDTNSRSIGVEIHNPGHLLGYRDFGNRQTDSVIALCSDIIRRHGITPQLVLAHSDVAPGRKIDPGEKFDWARLHHEGVGHWVEPSPILGGPGIGSGDCGENVAELQALLARYGYGLVQTGIYDRATETVVGAFQRHFRPARIDGIADASTIDTLRRLVAA